MSTDIDAALSKSFTPQRIIRAFYDYKIARWDSFSGFVEPKISIPMGADGVTCEAFERQLERNAENICDRVLNGTYTFYPFREINIPKEPPAPGKDTKYRILSIASVRDALVQGVLYEDVLYQPLEALFHILDTPSTVSYAYRKGKSAPQAGRAVYEYINTGYCHVLDADLSKYFDTIPHEGLLTRLAYEIGGSGSNTLRLIRRFTKADRVLHETYKMAVQKGQVVGYKIFHWQKPIRERRCAGVPQGGVLSGMLANLYLHDFDKWVICELGAQFDLKYVRYADDFIILTKSADVLSDIHDQVRTRIELLKLNLNPDKTQFRHIGGDGLDFVGFHFDGSHIRVQEKNVSRYRARVLEAIKNPPDYIQEREDSHETLKWVSRRIRYKVQGRAGEEVCPRCGYQHVGPPRSWMAFFQVVTDNEQLRQLDKWTREIVYEYIYQKYGVRLKRKDLRQVGLRSLVNERYRIGATRLKPCLCDIARSGVWYFVKDMFQGKIQETLARHKPFIVKRVDNSCIRIFVDGRGYELEKATIEQIWNRLLQGEIISRANLESEGLKNTSHIVALMAQFPGIHIMLWPIRLQFREAQPAGFAGPPIPFLAKLGNNSEPGWK